MARPSKLTPAIQEEICKAIRVGNYIETAAAYAGINKSTLYDWLKQGARATRPNAYSAFSNAVEKALADAEVKDVLTITRAAKSQWQAAAWRLERKHHERWGRKDKMALEHSGDMTITVKLPDDVSDSG